MVTTYLELVLHQGSTFTKIITLKDETTNDVLDISSLTFRGQLRRSYYSQNSSANLVCTIIDGSNGVFNVALDWANTTNLRPGKYVFDVESIDGNTINRVVEGTIFVSPQVTK